MCSFDPDVRARLSQHHHCFMAVIEHNLPLWIERHGAFERLARETAQQLSGAGHVSAEMLITTHATSIAAAGVGLTESFIELANADRVYRAPPVVRSLYETCCVPCYMARELLPPIRKGRA